MPKKTLKGKPTAGLLKKAVMLLATLVSVSAVAQTKGTSVKPLLGRKENGKQRGTYYGNSTTPTAQPSHRGKAR